MITVETRDGVRYFVFHDSETGLHTEAPVGGFGVLFADEIKRLRGQVNNREEAARWLYGVCTGTLTWKDVQTDEHPAKRWPWLEPKSVEGEMSKGMGQVNVNEVLKENEQLRELLAAAGARKPACEWSYDDTHDKYDTACGSAWQFNDGDLSENRIVYCPFCGGAVNEAAKGGRVR